MAQILRFPLSAKVLQFSDRAFDAETTALICRAFYQTCRALNDGGQPDAVKEIIAKRVIETAARGERDVDKMCEAALISLGVKMGSRPEPIATDQLGLLGCAFQDTRFS
jgi:hypothetical protein